MSKDIYTPRSELICGKLDMLYNILSSEIVKSTDLIRFIRHDAIRMEAKLILRKQEVRELRVLNGTLIRALTLIATRLDNEEMNVNSEEFELWEIANNAIRNGGGE
jgi:hypothetical protein